MVHPSRALVLVAASGLAQAACFELAIPAGAQITCSVDDPRCPAGLQCCEGRSCLQQCACPGGAEPCGLNGAVDCGSLRLCADHCWQPCPSCAERCASDQYKPCQVRDFDEVWYCGRGQACVVKFGPAGTTPTATCHPPPPQCADDDAHVCACLQAPFSVSPPCAPFEQCADYAQQHCVACRQREAPPADAGPREAAPIGSDSSAIARDAGVVGVDVHSNPPDGASGGLDGAGVGDTAPHESPALLAESAPACYTTAPAGSLCCLLADQPAQYSAATGTYDCAGTDQLATECSGFDDSCQSDSALCDPTDPCRWAYCQGGAIQCVDDGPPAPCNGSAWVCPPGSVVRSRCGGPCLE